MSKLRTTPARALILGVALAALCMTPLAVPVAQAQSQASEPGAPVRDPKRIFRRHVTSWLELRQKNVVMQQRDYSCGAAALATLIRYHWGDKVSETQILIEVVRLLTRAELQERVQNGLSLTDLRRVSVRMGYLATIGRLEFDKLRESKVPLIVGIIVDGYDHFVVFRGADGEFVYLADPARGKIRIPIPDFVKQWQENAVLVVVKKGVKAERTSPLTVTYEEKSLGELNRMYLRDQVSTPRTSIVLPR